MEKTVIYVKIHLLDFKSNKNALITLTQQLMKLTLVPIQDYFNKQVYKLKV